MAVNNALNTNIFKEPKYRKLRLEFHEMSMENLEIQMEYYICTTCE